MAARQPALSPAPRRSVRVRVDRGSRPKRLRKDANFQLRKAATSRRAQKAERRPEASIPCRIERFLCRPVTGRKTGISELGRQIAVDLKADADFDENGRGPCHDIAPYDGPLGAEMLRRLNSPISGILSVRQGSISIIAITDSTTTPCYTGAIPYGGEVPNER